MPEDVIPIAALLEEFGVVAPDAVRPVRAALEAAGLTNKTKKNIAVAKREAVEAVIRGFARSCGGGACQRAMTATGRPVIRVESAWCESCGGSTTERSILEMAAALETAGLTRLLVVGGSPASRTQLRETLRGSSVQLRLVEGNRATGVKQARDLAEWADVIVIWGNTQLDHKVSAPFAGPEYASRRLTAVQRGAASLALAVVEHVRRRAARPV